MRFDYTDRNDTVNWMFYIICGFGILMFLGVFVQMCGVLAGETRAAAERSALAYVAASHPNETVGQVVCARESIDGVGGVPCTVSFKSGRHVYLACAGAYTTNEGCWPAPLVRQFEEE